jgi:hypothetical protein
MKKLSRLCVYPFTLLIPGILCFILLKCNRSSVVNESVVEMEILVPHLTDTLPSIEHGFLVAKYDSKKVGLLTWYYSLNQQQTWKAMSVADNGALVTNEVRYEYAEDPYSYNVRRWWPSLDTLSDTIIFIRLTAYGGAPSIVKGPIVIR